MPQDILPDSSATSDPTALLTPNESELRAAAIDDVGEFDSEAPMLMENIDAM